MSRKGRHRRKSTAPPARGPRNAPLRSDTAFATLFAQNPLPMCVIDAEEYAGCHAVLVVMHELRRLEQQLLHAQKMEAVGRLSDAFMPCLTAPSSACASDAVDRA